MKEEIKPVIIDGKDSGWKASNFGYLIKPDGKTMVGRRNSCGYLRVSIKRKEFLMQRLIAELFIKKTKKNPDGTTIKGRAQVNHIDHNKENNRADNLEWCDQSYNMRHWNKNSENAKHTAKVYQCIQTGEIGTAKWFAGRLGVNHTSIRHCAIKNSTIHGLNFKECMLGGGK